MDKKRLQEIFSSPYSLLNWRDVLAEVFGARQLHQIPQPIPLIKKEKAEAAFELGNFNTSDDRIIGIYQVDIKSEVWLERNKVGLRELLRDVYKNDVDGALIVFVQEDKWRLSFVSEIRTINDIGEIETKATEPKRYTYLLGTDEKTKTPVSRLFAIEGKIISLEDILSAFSVEALNEEFYKIVARYFYMLIGGKEGKGAKEITYERILKIPGLNADKTGASKIYQEFAVRLIGRIVFCWFLKVKKSNSGISLLPEHLLSSKAVINNPNYYHFILETLFFQTLNTPMDERIKSLPNGCEQIPFLNGGLFEPHADDYYKPNHSTGLSDNISTLKIKDEWFTEFFENLEQYNFTIDENSVVDIEVSVDPEMLGRIFENLLAEIDPDSGETARTATGSFYTPREIVDYMATESLVHYLQNETTIDKESLHSIFKIDSESSFTKNEAERILEALDRLKILDPACGSGAFPMGVLQKIVLALQKLDNNADWWKARQISRIENSVLRKQVKEKMQLTTVEYARKIGVIQNSLYGVDIQPIAAEISKLRCFLTLIVDENIDETKPNRGVEPLPNLEFKFVTADALSKLPSQKKANGMAELFGNDSDLDRLQEIRLDYLQSYGKQKIELKERFLTLQMKIFKQQLSFGANENSKAYKVSSWNPFSHEIVDWFDPLWMYGIKEFDVVIGNPPYGIKYTREEIESFRKEFKVVVGHAEAYYLFSEKAFSYLKPKGVLVYITPNAWMSNKYAKGLRRLFLINKELLTIINLNKQNIFKNASVENSIFLVRNKLNESRIIRVGNSIDESKSFLFDYSDWLSSENLLINFSENPIIENILSAIKAIGLRLSEELDISNGFKPYQVGYGKNLDGRPLTKEDVENRIYHSDKKIDSQYKKQVKGKNINKYSLSWTEGYIKWGHWLMSPKSERYHTNPKILLRQIIGDTLIACYDDEQYYADQTLYVLINYSKSKKSLKFYTAILNSKVMGFYFRKFYSEEDDLFPKIKVNELKDLPVPSSEKVNVIPFENLVDYITFLKKSDSHYPVNEYVPNSHMVELFEEVMNALVYELYFEEDFIKAGIAFMRYTERDIISIQGLDEINKIETINSTYQKLREKDNEIRQNLKLMDTRLAGLIMPIKTTK